MTPVESRNETNRNSVRMFGPEKLNKSVAAQKWDRVKIVCTQPFNKVSSAKFKNFSTLHTCISILFSIYHSLIYSNTLLLVFEVDRVTCTHTNANTSNKKIENEYYKKTCKYAISC